MAPSTAPWDASVPSTSATVFPFHVVTPSPYPFPAPSQLIPSGKPSQLEWESNPSSEDYQLEDGMGPPSSLKLTWLSFVLICIAGIVLNVGVFCKRKISPRRQSSSTQISLSLLCIMAAADTVCLIALLCLLSLRYLGIKNTMVLSMVCKLDVFVIHSASAFSIWCWLVLSAVRYVAVYKPYTHLKMHKEPHLAVIGIAVLCCVSESWLLYDITYVPELKGCESLRDEDTNRKLQIMEIIISYFLPVAIITVLDLKECPKSAKIDPDNGTWPNCLPENNSVLLCRSVWFPLSERPALVKLTSESTESDSRTFDSPLKSVLLQSARVLGRLPPTFDEQLCKKARAKRRAQQLRVLRRCLCITIFDLSMNLPSYVYRLYLNTLTEREFESLNQELLTVIEMVSQIMYFAQFSLNALYLICIIYDTPKNRKGKPLHQQSACSYTSHTTLSAKKSSAKECKQLILPEF